jgi:hypothetical protein
VNGVSVSIQPSTKSVTGYIFTYGYAKSTKSVQSLKAASSTISTSANNKIKLATALPAFVQKNVILKDTSSSSLLAKNYQKSNVRLEMEVFYTKPGVIIDTVGINAAPIGSFSAHITKAGNLNFQIYDPKAKSSIKNVNGWHVITSKTKLAARQTNLVVIEQFKGEIALWVGKRIEQRIKLATPLSGQPLYIGDFPGDDKWGKKYNIHPALTGRVNTIYLGPLDKKVYRTLKAHK